MDEPEFLICLDCETPNYDFDFANGQVVDITCNTCGNDDPTHFMTEAEYEALGG